MSDGSVETANQTAGSDAIVSVVVALGSNLGDRGAAIVSALDDLRATSGVADVASSSLYETVALTDAGLDETHPTYLNAVALIETSLSPRALLARLHAIEDAHGRVREAHWGDRTLDLDLIDYAGVRYDDEALTLPHPRAYQRDFVLAPWLEVDPNGEIPGRGRIDALLAEIDGGEAAVLRRHAAPAATGGSPA